MRWLKRHPTVVNLVLAFLVATFVALWVNLVTNGSEPSDRKHALLLIAVALLAFQCWYNLRNSSQDESFVGGVLDLAIRFFVAHAAKPNVGIQELRIIVHLQEMTSPGAKLLPQRCLVPRYWRSPVPLRDFGAIPLDAAPFKNWYVNVRAFHKQQVVCGEPTETERPEADGFYVHAPSLFDGKSVISTPIWSRMQPPSVLGTVTVDSKLSLEELGWYKDGRLNEAVKDMMDVTANLLGKMLSDDETKL
jgi:hypothetical protein